MKIKPGDKLELKKAHPCGYSLWEVLRVGQDFRIRCTGCGHQLMIPRIKLEKSIKQIYKDETGDQE